MLPAVLCRLLTHVKAHMLFGTLCAVIAANILVVVIANRDVSGLCKIASQSEIEVQDWSLNPGRYVGVAPGQAHEREGFEQKLESFSPSASMKSMLAPLSVVTTTNGPHRLGVDSPKRYHQPHLRDVVSP